MRTMEQATTEDVFPQRMMSNVLGVFSIFALLLAALGTYAIVAQGVSERRQELAIRTAFGAKRRDLIRLAFRQMTFAIAVGLVLGIALSLGLGRGMQGFLFGITGFSPATVLLTTSTLVVCASLAIYFPARRAASVDPMVDLRQE
jgi:putative ABC transport system permease protein